MCSMGILPVSSSSKSTLTVLAESELPEGAVDDQSLECVCQNVNVSGSLTEKKINTS